jgi:hypothetical protein
MVVHHLYGELENQACDSPPCECGGGRVCFDLVTRDGASENRTSFRINNNNLTIPLVAGDCVEMVAPLGRFNGTLQFDIDNFSWQRWFGNSEG